MNIFNKTTLKKILEDKTSLSLLFLNILFFTYYVMLAFYSRFHFDELHTMLEINERGIIGYLIYLYYGSGGRFVFFFIDELVLKISMLLGEYRFFPILFWFLGVLM